MERQKVFLVDKSCNGFRLGKPAEIVGVEMCTPKGLEPRLCYHLLWSDQVEDFKPVNENDYEIITFDELVSGDYNGCS